MTDQPLADYGGYATVDELLEQAARIATEWDKLREFLVAADETVGETANAYRAIARDAYWKMEVSWNRLLQKMMPTLNDAKNLAFKDKMPDATLERNPIEEKHWEDFQRKAEELKRQKEAEEQQRRVEQSASDTASVAR